MTSILDGELAETLVDALDNARLPQAMSITREEVDPESPPWDPSSITVSYACRGWVDEYKATDRLDGSVSVNDRKAYVLVSSLATTPTSTDHLVLGSLNYSIARIDRDPAGAAWVLQVNR
jgi:hypothetical protein